MEKDAGEIEDWEMLQITEEGLLPSESDDKSSGLDGGCEHVIRSDYFALDSQRQYGKKAVEEDQEQVSLILDASSAISHPCLKPGSVVDAKGDLGFQGIEISSGNSGVPGSDWSGNGSVGRNFAEFEGKDELGYGVDVKNEVDFEGIGEIAKLGAEQDNSIEFWLDSGSNDGSTRNIYEKRELGHGADAKRVDFEGTGIESKNSGEFMLDTGGNESVSAKFEGVMGEDELNCGGDLSKMGDGSESGGVMEFGGEDGSDSAAFVQERVEFPSGVEEGGGGGGAEVNLGDGGKKGVIWYKLPLELLKFCIFRISPVWSVSIAAAVVGFVILKKRLYKMRRKSRNVPLKVSMDDKVSSCHSPEHFIYLLSCKSYLI